MIFEYDATSNSLFSIHHNITLPDSSKHSRIYLSPNVTRYRDQKDSRNLIEVSSTDGSNIFMSRSEDGNTFLFDANENYSLIGAFGHSIDLHSINHPSHKVFINHFFTTEPFNIGHTITSSSKPRICERKYEILLDVITDHIICSRTGNQDILTLYMIEQFIFQSIKMFSDLTCIDIRFMRLNSHCSDTKYFNFQQSKCENHQNSNKPTCQSTSGREIMLEILNYPFNRAENREIVLFISGIPNAGDLAGLTYKSRACDTMLSNIWIKGLSQVAFFHEIGHLLGAGHARDGIMQEKVSSTQSLYFSSQSLYEINHFIEEDSRSWCFRRKYTNTESEVLEDRWVTKKLLLPNKVQVQDLKFESISIASLSSDKKVDLLFLISDKDETNGSLTLYYGSIKNIWGINQISREELKYKSLGLVFPDYCSYFSLRFFTSRHSESKRVILSYLEFKNNGVEVPHYKVGSITRNGDIDITSWTEERDVEGADLRDWDHRALEIDMSIGNIRSQESIDVLYMQLNSETYSPLLDDTFNGRMRTLKYKVGFNMSATGLVQSGWSEYFTIRGKFYNARSISGSITGIDGNGIPDFVLYVVESGFSSRESGYSYFRIGKDINSAGVVTGGWSDYKTTPSLGSTRFKERSMDVAKDFKSGQYTMITAERHQGGIILELSISQKGFLNKVMKTVKKYSTIESVMGNCEICNDGPSVNICQRKLHQFKYKIDELRISKDPQRETISIDRIETSFGNFGRRKHYFQNRKNITFDNFMKETNLDFLNTSWNSIYCEGFNYILTFGDVCNTIDGKSVYSKGLETSFTQNLLKLTAENNIHTRSLFEDPFGTNGGGKPTLVQAHIRGRKTPSKQAIRTALGEEIKRLQFPAKQSFTYLAKATGEQLLQTKMKWNKKQKLWIVSIYLRATGFQIFR